MPKERPAGAPRELLPGEAVVDTQLLDQAVADIHTITIEAGLKFHLAIGRIVIDRFFGGDRHAFNARHLGHASYRALAQRDDLPVGHTTISNAVRLTQQMELIPRCGTQLNLTQHRALFPLLKSKPTLIASLARRAIEESLTASELKQLVDRQRGQSNAGRPKLPAFEKTLNLFDRVASKDDSFEDLEVIDRLDPDEARAMLHKVRGLRHQLAHLQRRLQRRTAIDGAEDAPSLDSDLSTLMGGV